MSDLWYPRLDRQVTVHDYIPGQPIPAMIKDPAGDRIITNPLLDWVKPFTLSIEGETLTLPASTTPQPSEPIPMVIDGKGHFEIMQAFFKSQRSEGFTVQLFDADMRPLLMNREVHVATIASGGGTSTNYETFGAAASAGRPFRWPETFFMNVEEHGRVIFAVFRNLSTSSNVIRFGLHGQRWFHMQAPQGIANRMQQIYRTRFRTMPFFYTTDGFVSVVADATTEFTIRFTDEAWTEVMKIMSVSTNSFLVRIRETATNKPFMSDVVPATQGFVHSLCAFGDGEFPFLHWDTDVFEPNFKLTFQFRNTIVSATNVIWLTLGCRKIMPDPQETRLLRPGVATGGGM